MTLTRHSVTDVAELLDDAAVDTIVCCGSGGVGKTTTAAALAVRAAEQGRHVVVLTIDPARRLAQSLGLESLDNTPRPVDGVDTSAGGSLEAMMLDMKRTFDDVVTGHASPEKARAIMENPFYIAMSTSFAGTSEYMAMEKLSQLRSEASVPGGSGAHRWDLIIIDTPPSRSALDFLDAPDRLSSFLDGRFIRVLMMPAKAGGRLGMKTLSSVVGGVSGVMGKLLGQQTLRDVQTFVAAMDSMFGGFRERAEQTYAMLRGAGTAFVVVAAPDVDALREASFFVRRLRADDMPLAGVVVNRLVTVEADVPASAAADAADFLASRSDQSAARQIAEGLLRVHAGRQRRRDTETELVAGFARSQPDVPLASIPQRSTDVFDLDTLRAVASDIAEVPEALR